MKITKDTLNKLAHLARIRIDPEHEGEYIKDLEQIVTWVEKLEELELKDDQESRPDHEIESLREDRMAEGFPREKILKNAPMKKDGFFEVPNIMKKK